MHSQAVLLAVVLVQRRDVFRRTCVGHVAASADDRPGVASAVGVRRAFAAGEAGRGRQVAQDLGGLVDGFGSVDFGGEATLDAMKASLALGALLAVACAASSCAESDPEGEGGSPSAQGSQSVTSSTKSTSASPSSTSSGDGGNGGNGGDGGNGGNACVGAAWSESFGDAMGQYPSGLAVDGSNNVFLSGLYEGTMDFGGGALPNPNGYSIFLAKRDANGAHVWAKSLGDAGLGGRGTVLATDTAGNVYVTGDHGGTVDLGGGALFDSAYIGKLDPTGAHVWSKSFLGEPWGIAIDGVGDIVMIGRFLGTLDLGGGPIVSQGLGDVFVAKLTGAGDHVWSYGYGDENLQVGAALAIDSADNVVVSAFGSGSIDFGGGPLTSTHGRLLMAKLDPMGGHIWSKQFGDDGSTIGLAMATDASDNVVVAGNFDATVDFGGGPLVSTAPQQQQNDDIFVAKLDSAGDHVWSQTFGADGFQSVLSLKVGAQGSITMTGRAEVGVDFGGGTLTAASALEDAFVAVLAADGTHVWSRLFGDVGSDVGADVALDTADHIIVSGVYEGGNVDLGCGPLPASQDTDIFLGALTAP
ncbi:MAG: hypothetical protein HOV80_21745 [Polyangiaceae bacterium]|nr:hypothetical protein [Polyangiaceae bacterium]